MGIDLIPNQRFAFNQPDSSCNYAGGHVYCQLFNNDDLLYLQFKQTPCAVGSLLCNGDLVSTYGVERITNGSFTTNASGWTLSGGASYSAGAHDIQMTGYSSLNQTSIAGIVNTHVYLVSFDVKQYLGGSLDIDVLGNLISIIPTTTTYQFTVIASANDITFIGDANGYVACNFQIDNVSIKEVTFSCWTYTNTDIILGSSGVCHITGTATDLVQANVVITSLYYKAIVTISNRTQGSVEVLYGTSSIATLTANGDQSIYGQSNGTDLTLRMSDDFDGCIDDVSLQLIRTDFIYVLKDVNNVFIANVSPGYTNGITNFDAGDNEYVTYSLAMSLGSITNISSAIMPYGCYKICMYDPCLVSIEFDNVWVTTPGWTPSDPDRIHSTVTNASGWFMEATSNGNGSAVLTSNGSTSTVPFVNWTAGQMKMIVNVEFVTGNIDNNTNRIYITLPHAAIPVTTLIATNVVSNTKYSLQVVIDVDNTAGAVYQNKMIMVAEFDTMLTGDQNQIRYLSITALPMSHRSASFDSSGAEYCSNCLSWKESHSCTVLVKGSTTKPYQFGFYFTPFQLLNRLRVLSYNPSYIQDEEDYLYSSGTRAITYSSSEKYYTILFDYVDEITHDNINTMINSDNFIIDGSAYYVKKGNYQPDWDKDGKWRVAQSRIEAKSKDKAIFNTNCS